MATTTIRFNNTADSASTGSFMKLARALDDRRAREMCNALAEYFVALAGGYETGDFEVQLAGTTAVRATGTLTIASGTGAVGGTIGGTLKTVTWATSDTASAAALAAAINADTTINKLVFATSAAGVVTLKALSPTAIGNKITLVASGTGVTASGATLTTGAGDDVIPVTFSRS
jgi:phage tail sheath gpL-like